MIADFGHIYVSDCGSVVRPINGNMQGAGSMFGDVVTFSCSTGFQLFGVDSITCGADGQWSAVAPECHITGALK